MRTPTGNRSAQGGACVFHGHRPAAFCTSGTAAVRLNLLGVAPCLSYVRLSCLVYCREMLRHCVIVEVRWVISSFASINVFW